MLTGRTPQERAQTVRVAGLWIRSIAALIDLGVLCPVLFSCALALRLALPAPVEADGELAPWLLELLLERHSLVVAAVGFAVAVLLAYEALFLGLYGHTIGQQLLGLRVIDEEGGAPDLPTVALRVGALPVGLFFLGLGALWIAFDREARGFHDHVSGTLVVRRAGAGLSDLQSTDDLSAGMSGRRA